MPSPRFLTILALSADFPRLFFFLAKLEILMFFSFKCGYRTYCIFGTYLKKV